MNLKEQFETADKAIKDLGLTHPFKIEDIKLTEEETSDLEKHKAVMVITPIINRSFNTKDLFNSLKKLWNEDRSYFYDEWKNYFKDDYQKAKISFVYMDGDNGLYGKGRSLEDNKTELEKLQEDTPRLRSLNPIEYMMLQAIYKDNPVDTGWSWTRFIDASLRGFLRGGTWDRGSNAGVSTLTLSASPSLAYSLVGFRVSR
jgi:hypothetical protein